MHSYTHMCTDRCTNIPPSIHTHINIYAGIHTHTHTYMPIHVHVHTYIHISTDIYKLMHSALTHAHIYRDIYLINICRNIYRHTCKCIYLYIYRCTYKFICAHTLLRESFLIGPIFLLSLQNLSMIVYLRLTSPLQPAQEKWNLHN